MGYTQDISLGGFCLESPQVLKEESICKLKIFLSQEDSISPICKIRWVNETKSGFLAGVEFWELSYRDKLILTAKIKTLDLQAKINNQSARKLSSMDYKIKETEAFLSEVDFFIQEAENDLMKIVKVEDIPTNTEKEIKTTDFEQMIIKVSDDKLMATADFYPRPDHSILRDNEIVELLTLNNIKIEVNWENINSALNDISGYGEVIQDVLIAKGKKPVEHIPEHIQIKSNLIENNYIPDSVTQKIDYHELSPFKSVVKDEEVAMIIAEQPGKEGINIEGQKLPFTTKERAAIKIGDNLVVSGSSVRSNCYGNFHFENDEIYVSELLHIKNDIDYSTGNIKFLGDIVVDGKIREGFKVICGGSLFCKGTIELNDIFVQNDLICQAGIIGRKEPLLRVGGRIVAKFIERCYVECRKNVHVERGIVNSHINTLDKVTTGSKGRIQSSEIVAQNGVECGQLGSPGGSETKISMGINFIINKRIQLIKMKSEKLVKTLDMIENSRESQSATMTPVKTKVYKGLRNLEDLVENLLTLLHTNEEARLKVKNKIYPVLSVSICHMNAHYTNELPRSEFSLNKSKGSIDRR